MAGQLGVGANYTHLNANTATAIITGPIGPNATPACAGLLFGLEINTPGTSWVITLYDGTVAQNIVIAVIASAAAQDFRPMTPIQLKNGLTFSAAGTAGDCTVIWL